MPEIKELEPKDLYRRCDPEDLGFTTTDELEDYGEILGQPRAVAAVELGLGIDHDGFNIYALGPAGTGRHFAVRHFLEKQAASDPVPKDWIYVNNFEEEHKPRAIAMEPGRAAAFRQDMAELVEELHTTLSAAFESEDYHTRLQVIDEEFGDKQGQIFEDLRAAAREKGLGVVRTPLGLVFAPIKDGEVLSPEEFNKLPEEEREKLEKVAEPLQQEFEKFFRQVPRWQRERRERIRQLNREMTHFAVGPLFEELRHKYGDTEEVARYLEAAEQDVVRQARAFVEPEQGSSGGDGQPAQAPGPGLLRRYQINVIVDRGEAEGAPVVYEENPTLQNLIGRVEHLSQMGTLLTDFTLIKAGALHRANGGYLLLDALQLLRQPYSWEALKRILKAGQIKVESLAQAFGLVSTVSLEPEPIPLSIRVVLVGDRFLYYLLSHHDPDFSRYFKVAADFDDRLDWSPENQGLYARLVASMVRRQELKPFDSGAVARVLEHSAREAADSRKLSLNARGLADLLREADYWAASKGRDRVTGDDVQQAIDAQVFRSDRMRERLQEGVARGILLIASDGEAVGQVNGLSVLQLGSFSFGHPSRITARVRLGDGEVVNIEREVELSGPIHSKGVLILTGFLGGRYALSRPLSLAASLVFEQGYSGVDGDSASFAELAALLSSISGVPIRQNLAVTGSINQHGDIQPIGGANQKIEGFFDICKTRGLTGSQGVAIPASNVQHLMLRRDVVDAVAAGRFHIYPISSVDEGLELLTGMPAGERDEEGSYPEGSLNQLVEAQLAELAEVKRSFGAAAAAQAAADGDEEGGGGDDGGDGGENGGEGGNGEEAP